MAGECFYCGARLVKEQHSYRSQSIDHIIPRSVIRRSGVKLTSKQHKLNCVKCCTSCNHRKGSKHPGHWMVGLSPDVREEMNLILQLLPVTLIYNQAARYSFD